MLTAPEATVDTADNVPQGGVIGGGVDGARTKTKVTEEWLAERRENLPGELLALISRCPGMVKTYYLYLPVDAGGPRGMSDYKYAALQKLMDEGKVVLGVNRGKVKKIPGLYPAGHPLRFINLAPEADEVDKMIEASILNLVQNEPGRGETYYCRVPLGQGGVRGSQQRKERVMARLLAENKLLRVKLPTPVKRMTHAIYPLSVSLGAQREVYAAGANVASSEE